MKVSLTTKTSVIILVVASVIFYIGATTISLSLERMQNSQLASKQIQLIEMIDSVVLDLNRAEDREHEYLVSGSREALDANFACYKRIDGYLKNLHQLFSDTTRYVMLLDELTESVTFRKSCGVEVMKQRDISGTEAALERSRKFDEGRLTQHVEWVAKEVSRTINREMSDRINELDKGQLTSLVGTAVILCSSLLALVVLVLVVNRYVQERYFAEKSLREAQKALSEREARMRALVDTAPDGIVTIRTSGRIESANAVFGQMMSCPLTNIIERDINNFIPDFLLEDTLKSGTDGANKQETMPFGAVRELTAVRDNGEKFAVEVSVNVVKLDKKDVYIGIVRDITERKEVEERVKDFYSMVSHELRTPLASIRTALGIMENSNDGDGGSNQTNLVLKIAANETDRLMRLINDILDMRKVESGKLDLLMDVLEADFIVSRAVDGVKGLATEAQLTIATRIEPGLYLYCDEDRTLQVLTNFLANAIKFSPVGKTITVECSTMGESCRFAVTDQGPGLPKAEIHKLFGRFEQLRSTDGRQRPGSGLGLAIAKAIVEQHGGQIGVEQPESGGSTFWFSLPLAKEDEEEDEGEPVEEAPAASGPTLATAAALPDGERPPTQRETVQDKILSTEQAEVVLAQINVVPMTQVSPVSGKVQPGPLADGTKTAASAARTSASKSSRSKKSKKGKR